MTYSQLRQLNMNMQLVQKLVTIPLVTPQATYQLKKIFDNLRAYSTKIQEELEEVLVKPFAMRDEKGEIIRPEGRPMDFDIAPEKRADFEKAQEEFYNKTLTVDRVKLKLSDFSRTPLSVADLDALTPILDMEEEVMLRSDKNVVSLKA
jgi:hypothetical protein